MPGSIGEAVTFEIDLGILIPGEGKGFGLSGGEEAEKDKKKREKTEAAHYN
jgi:hypothetical protein